ncbi:SAF domain-containing protein [Corynebacterium mayonis]|uniref:SAF domain-containing protein n=1 Tax=Corynebacterium mayonis TaxID=3062461 RepID=UPI003140193F
MKLLDLLRTPGHRRATLVRRAAAAALLFAAALSGVTSRTAAPEVTVFARDVDAGAVIETGDVTRKRLPSSVVPERAVFSPAEAEGKILAAEAAAGEVVTTTRLVGPDLTAGLVPQGAEGSSYTLVPVVLAEPDIIPMLHHGAGVSVISLQEKSGAPLIVAEGGKVVVAGQHDSTVLLLLPDSQAKAVAAASLGTPLTVVLDGRTL